MDEKIWKAGGSRENYVTAKRLSNLVIYLAKNESFELGMQKDEADMNRIFRLAKQLKKNNTDIIGEKGVLNDTSAISLNIGTKKAAWNEHCIRLLNHEFPRDESSLTKKRLVGGPSALTRLVCFTKLSSK